MNRDRYWLLARAISYQRATRVDSDMQKFADGYWEAASLFNGMNDDNYNVIFEVVADYLKSIKENLNYDE